MNKEEFARLCQEFTEKEAKLLTKKRADYAIDDDCLRNFREVSSWMGLSPEHYCMVLAMKHAHSILKAITTDEFSWSWEQGLGEEGLKQRIADVRNFFILLAALIEERCQEDNANAE